MRRVLSLTLNAWQNTSIFSGELSDPEVLTVAVALKDRYSSAVHSATYRQRA